VLDAAIAGFFQYFVERNGARSVAKTRTANFAG